MRVSTFALLLCASATTAQTPDAGYTAKIREYTTEPFFLTELVDHLPASATVPTPEKVLGYIVGTPEKLTYSKDLYAYLRRLEQASPRVKVFTIGKTEEGRDTLLVAISDERNIAALQRLKQNTARLADPRRTPQEEASRIIAESVPFYWATGSIHSNETGSPEMMMELAYRLAVGETPIVQSIRRNTVVLLTPLVEVDGHDRYVDHYNWRKANPERAAPPFVYWGKYVAHDNNRDNMGLSLALSRNMTNAFLEWHPQVLHDLHESIPFLYTSTGMGPYNAWLDPITINEIQRLAWFEVEEMTKRGVPGVWTHGFYDGWAANYMKYVATGHNAIGRFYETYGGIGADTRDRTVPAASTVRTWFRPNPPLPKVKWSLRNNVNLQQSALMLAIEYFGRNGKDFLNNFYLKSRRSVEKARKEGPAAWILPAEEPRPLAAAELVNLLRMHGVEVHRALKEVAVGSAKFGEGSYVIRIDQPYSRMADMLLDTQYYNPADPRPYDDTGWSLGPLRNVKTVRVTDVAVLDAAMSLLVEPAKVAGGITGSGKTYAINHNTEIALATLRFRLKDVRILAAEQSFQADGRRFAAGSFLIPDIDRSRLEKAVGELGLTAYALEAMPNIPTHPLANPRVALVHSWVSTQNEGWFRIALDKHEIPYTYLADTTLRDHINLRDRFDVIVYGPTSGSAQRIVNGIPLRTGLPIPWNESIGVHVGASPDKAADIRGGIGFQGLLNLQRFVEQGGVFVTIGMNASVPIDYGLVDGVSIVPARELQARGSVLSASISDKGSPLVYGYGDRLGVYFNQAPVFRASANAGFSSPPDTLTSRPSGRGTVEDADVPQGRPYAPPPPKPATDPAVEQPLSEEVRQALRAYLPLPGEIPRVVLKFADEKNLLVSGMLAGGRELAGRPALVDVRKGKGHYLFFAINPMWRQQTQGSFFLLFNAMLNFDNLEVGSQSH
jgi:hypothetical protein